MTSSTATAADASYFGLGAVMLQKNDDVLKPVAFSSCTISPTESH